MSVCTQDREAIRGSDNRTGRICELCGHRGYKVVSLCDRDGHPLETAICTGCGLVAHLHIPDDAELDAFYASKYRRQYHGETTPSPRRVMRAWENGRRIARQLAPFLRDHESLLEVGCGIGATVKTFELLGHRASGIDLGTDSVRYGRQALHAQVENAGLFDLPPEPRFDMVFLVHVIEHFSSPVRAMRAIHTLVKPGGRLYVECPNLAAPFATRKRLFHFAHVYNFTPWTLLSVARKCGFELERRFGDDGDPNLRMLLRRIERGYLAIAPQSYQRTLDRMSRCNGLVYHARWSYLTSRAKKVLGYLHERLAAGRFVRRLSAECRSL